MFVESFIVGKFCEVLAIVDKPECLNKQSGKCFGDDSITKSENSYTLGGWGDCNLSADLVKTHVKYSHDKFEYKVRFFKFFCFISHFEL